MKHITNYLIYESILNLVQPWWSHRMVIYEKYFQVFQKVHTLRKYFIFETVKLYIVDMKPYISGEKIMEELRPVGKDEGTILDPKTMEALKQRHKGTNQSHGA